MDVWNEVMDGLLEEGGVWVNLGPLNWRKEARAAWNGLELDPIGYGHVLWGKHPFWVLNILNHFYMTMNTTTILCHESHSPL